jgi:hypothetical protein
VKRPAPPPWLVGIVAVAIALCGAGVVVAALNSGGGDQPAPASSSVVETTPAAVGTTAPPPVVSTATTVANPPQQQTYSGVHPGAFCGDHWAYGRTVDGVLMRCTTTATDSRFRWRQS